MSSRTGEGVDRFNFDFGSLGRKPFLFNCDAQTFLDLRSSELTPRSLAVMMMLDLNGSQVKSQREYARIWGPSPTAIRNRWAEAIALVIMWTTGYGSQWTYELARKAKKEWPYAFAQWELHCKRNGVTGSTPSRTSVHTAQNGSHVPLEQELSPKPSVNENQKKRIRDEQKTQLERTTNNTGNQNPEIHNTQQVDEGLKKKLIKVGIRDSMASKLLLQFDEDCIVRNLSFYEAKSSPKTPGLLVKAIQEDYAASVQHTEIVTRPYRPSTNPLDHMTEEPI